MELPRNLSELTLAKTILPRIRTDYHLLTSPWIASSGFMLYTSVTLLPNLNAQEADDVALCVGSCFHYYYYLIFKSMTMSMNQYLMTRVAMMILVL